MRRHYTIFFLTIILSSSALLLSFSGCRSSIVDDPTTTITYALAEQSYVTLTVENSYNTIVATPVKSVQNAGQYAVSFDASHLSEGIYFYTLDAKSLTGSRHYISTRQMLLIK